MPPHPTRWKMPWAPVHTLAARPLCTLPARSQQGACIQFTSGVGLPHAISPMDEAKARAALLSIAEVRMLMEGPRAAAEAIAAGRGTRVQWVTLCHVCNVALAIESGGVVRGLAGHLAAIEHTLNAIAARAGDNNSPPTWRAPVLRAEEMEQVRLLVRLFGQQLSVVSAGEYEAAYRLAVARVQSCGGTVTNADEAGVAV